MVSTPLSEVSAGTPRTDNDVYDFAVKDCRSGDKKTKFQRVAQNGKGSPRKESSSDKSLNHCRSKEDAFNKRESIYSILDQDLQLSEDSDSDHEEPSTAARSMEEAKDSSKLPRSSDSKKGRKNSVRHSTPVVNGCDGAAATSNGCNSDEKRQENDSQVNSSSLAPENPWDIDYLLRKFLNGEKATPKDGDCEPNSFPASGSGQIALDVSDSNSFKKHIDNLFDDESDTGVINGVVGSPHEEVGMANGDSDAVADPLGSYPSVSFDANETLKSSTATPSSSGTRNHGFIASTADRVNNNKVVDGQQHHKERKCSTSDHHHQQNSNAKQSKRDKKQGKKSTGDDSSSASNITSGTETAGTANHVSDVVTAYSPGKENITELPTTTDVNHVSRSFKKNAEVILRESQLSPLLSPIHEFPPLEYYNGVPSLMCRLNLNLLDRIPSPVMAQIHVSSDDSASTLSVATAKCPAAKRESLAAESRQLPATAASTAPTQVVADPPKAATPAWTTVSNGPNVGKDLGTVKDLDDVPIIHRTKKLSFEGFRKSLKVPESKADTESCSNVKKEKSALSEDDTGHPPGPKQRHKSKSDKKPMKEASVIETAEEPPPKKDDTRHGVKRNLSSTIKTDIMDKALPAQKKIKVEDETMEDLPFAPVSPSMVNITENEPKYYLEKAKRIKHLADAQSSDKTVRILLYLESVIYFALTGHCMESTVKPESSRPHSMFKETCELLKGVACKHFAQASSLPPKAAKLTSMIDMLNLRVQSILCRKLFELRQSQAINNYRHISQYQRSTKDGNRNCASAPSSSCSFSGQTDQGQNGAASSRQPSPKSCSASSAHSPTPSPASSTGSSQSLPPGLVAIPQNVEAMYKQQLSHLHNLMWAHQNWQLSDKKLKMEDKPFFDHLDRLCGALNFNSSIVELSVYVITAVDWLKQMHGYKVV